MKKYLFSTLLFVNSFLLTSQSFNVAEHNGSTRTFNMVGINNKSYYLEVNTPMQSCCYDEVHLIGRGNNGNEIMNLLIGAYGAMDYAQVTVSEKQTLLVYAGTEWGECDIEVKKFFVSEIDTLGNVLWSSIISNQKVEALLPLSSGNRIMLASNSLYKLNSSGQTVSTYTVDYGSSNNPFNNTFNSACVLNNENILLSYSSILKEVDTLGNTINTVTISPIKKLSQVATGQIYGISGNMIKLSPTYNVLSTASLSNFSANAYCYKNDSIFVIGNDANSIPKYVLLDTAFNILHQSSSNLEQVVCTGLTADNNLVKVLSFGASNSGNMNYNTGTHFFSSYFHTKTFGDLNGTKDIGVIDVIIDSARHITNTSVSNYWVVKGRIIVKNFGTEKLETIKDFRLNHYTSAFLSCIVGLNKRYDIILNPGETATVATDSFNSFSYPNVCIFTTVPDSTNDYDITNNQKCITSTVNVTGVQEYSQETELNIFPNPSNGLVNIHAEQDISEIEIFDYSGKRIGIYFPNTATFELKENTLASGLYFFKITTANYTAVRKVVIE